MPSTISSACRAFYTLFKSLSFQGLEIIAPIETNGEWNSPCLCLYSRLERSTVDALACNKTEMAGTGLDRPPVDFLLLSVGLYRPVRIRLLKFNDPSQPWRAMKYALLRIVREITGRFPGPSLCPLLKGARGHRTVISRTILMVSLLLLQTEIFAQQQSPDNPAPSTRVLYRESFDYPNGALPDSWWSEGKSAAIKEGKLYVDANHTVATVWLDREFSGNLRIEYDVHMESSVDHANNMNCFFLYSDARGKPLRDSRNSRKSGDYRYYHACRGYIFTDVADRKTISRRRFRLRDCPGFRLLQEKYTYENKIGTTYHVEIEKLGNRIRIFVDGKLVLDKTDNEKTEHAYIHAHKGGLFGFRTYHTELWWDDLVVTTVREP